MKSKGRRHLARNLLPCSSFHATRTHTHRLIAAAGIAEETTWGSLSPKALSTLVDQIKASTLITSGKSTNKDEFVTCGGISLKEIDFRSMESKKRPGLHFAGEVIDIDGVTGGWNFQACWCGGYIAGQAMAQGLKGL